MIKQKTSGLFVLGFVFLPLAGQADGTGLVPLTTATSLGANSYEPQWSPDGSKVVFESSRKLDGTDAPNLHFTSNIWRVNVDGTGPTPLTNVTADGAGSGSPSFSP
jgi:Tol biopolymer transport system component